MRKDKNQHGFTLAELLIVVAVIAVLVAISVPIFSEQLERSRDATSVANIRSAYSMAQTEYIEMSSSNPKTFEGKQIGRNYTDRNRQDPNDPEIMSVYFNDDHTIKQIVVLGVEIKSKKRNGWSHLGDNLPFAGKWVHNNDSDNNGDPGKPGKYRLVFNYDSNGNITSVQFLNDNPINNNQKSKTH